MGYKIISIGHACQVKHTIDRFFMKQETIFFDWLLIDFKSVLYVLKRINNPQSFITRNKFLYLYPKYETGCHKIGHYDFKMISSHDFPLSIPWLRTLPSFIDKYTRRLQRFKNILQETENIHMIHCIDHQFREGYFITNEDITEFFEYINAINPNNKVYLHIAVPPKYNSVDLTHLIQDKVYVYYLVDTKQSKIDWKNENFNWNIIFDNIKKIG